jgi:hypothetical protein
MSNALLQLRKAFQQPDSYKVGNVIKKNGENLTIEIESGVQIFAWGTADTGDTVLIKNRQVMARIDKAETQNIYVK